MSNSMYQVYTQHIQGVPVLPEDLVANAIFELGEPVQSLAGLNGFLTEVSADSTEGVIDIGAGQVYSASCVLEAGNHDVGTNVYYNPTTGALTTVSTGKPFGALVRVAYDDVFPVVGGVTADVNILLLNS